MGRPATAGNGLHMRVLPGDAAHGTSRSALARLVLYDLMILRRGARAAFARKRDILLLLVVVPLLLAFAISYAGKAAAAVGALPLAAQMAAAASIAMLVNAAIGHRLAYLWEHSMVARYALQSRPAAVHTCFWNLLPLGVVAGLIVASGPALTAALVLLAYAAGGALAAILQAAMTRLRAWTNRHGQGMRDARPRELRGVTRRQRAIALLAGRSGLFGPSLAANLLGIAAIGAAIGGLHLGLSSQMAGPAPLAIAGLLLLVALLALLRMHPSLLRYWNYLGLDPILPAVIAFALAAALVGGALAVSLPGPFASPFAILAAALTLLLLFLAIALLRTLHFATKPRQLAEMAMTVEIVAVALTGFLAPPLAPVLLIARIWLLAREARAMRHLAR